MNLAQACWEFFERMAYYGDYNMEEDELNDPLEDDGQGGHARTANDHVIMLVDARQNMLEPKDDNGGVRLLGSVPRT